MKPNILIVSTAEYSVYTKRDTVGGLGLAYKRSGSNDKSIVNMLYNTGGIDTLNFRLELMPISSNKTYNLKRYGGKLILGSKNYTME